MLLVKALDTRRRQEERDRRRQDLKEERAALKEKRREKKALDADAEMEQARPREDMSLKGGLPGKMASGREIWEKHRSTETLMYSLPSFM